MNTCNSCGNDNPAGVDECIYCGQSLVGSTVLPNVVPGVAQVLPPTAKIQIGSSGAASAVSVLIPIDPMTAAEDPVRAIQLPSGYFNFLIGRTDMSAGVVAPIDLLKLFPDIVDSPQGYIVSKRTANIRRDQNTGIVYLQHHPESRVEILVKRTSSPDLEKIMPGQEIQLDQDDRLFMGKNNSALEFVLR